MKGSYHNKNENAIFFYRISQNTITINILHFYNALFEKNVPL